MEQSTASVANSLLPHPQPVLRTDSNGSARDIRAMYSVALADNDREAGTDKRQKEVSVSFSRPSSLGRPTNPSSLSSARDEDTDGTKSSPPSFSTLHRQEEMSETNESTSTSGAPLQNAAALLHNNVTHHISTKITPSILPVRIQQPPSTMVPPNLPPCPMAANSSGSGILLTTPHDSLASRQGPGSPSASNYVLLDHRSTLWNTSTISSTGAGIRNLETGINESSLESHDRAATAESPETPSPSFTTMSRVRRLLRSEAVLRVISSIVLGTVFTCLVWYGPVSLCWLAMAILCSILSLEYQWLSVRALRYIVNDLNISRLSPLEDSWGMKSDSPTRMDLTAVPLNIFSPGVVVACNQIFGASKCKLILVTILSLLGGGVAGVLLAYFDTHVLCLAAQISHLEIIVYISGSSFVTIFCACLAPTVPAALTLFIYMVAFNMIAVHSVACDLVSHNNCPVAFNVIAIFGFTVVVLCLTRIASRDDPFIRLLGIVLDIVGLFYCVLLMSVIFVFTDHSPKDYGRQIMLSFLNMVWWSDSGAYLVGKALEQLGYTHHHLLAPQLSPKKDLEGTAGALVFGIIGMIVSKQVFGLPGNYWYILGFGAPAALVGRLGDLFESMIKRSARVKHTSMWIPGHGGFMDRLDSLLFVGVLFSQFLPNLRYSIASCP